MGLEMYLNLFRLKYDRSVPVQQNHAIGAVAHKLAKYNQIIPNAKFLFETRKTIDH